ncbi:heparin lyase I family protein [Taibaiella koreensis]|uniref:heparin lyase I family protein n=1 Tax=Taibaiella koreensis TaxID=1268548 RepID=UPI0013C3465A|nr:heparin lyase I family protein [Taibaiella koreensis]
MQQKIYPALISSMVFLCLMCSCGKAGAQFIGDTLLNITYESGTMSSGITGVNPTNASAADAAYMVSPGATGNYAIAHKIVHGDTAYMSNGAYRSESDADYVPQGRFLPGDERRYEFSVLLKDWTLWNPGDNAGETNIFQLKLVGPTGVPLQIRTQRNAIALRYAIAPYKIIVPDFTSYVNQWIHFRVDVLWANTATGYMKTYMKLPGQSDFVLVDDQSDYLTFSDLGNTSTHGYVKWGLYVTPPNLTRIAYHDDIRIINLNEPPVAPGLIWGDGILDANPGYLDGPYTKATTITNPAIFDNAGSVYIHPYVKYRASQNIVYSNSTNPPPNPADNVVGTPWADFSRATLIPGGSANGVPGPGGRYYLTGWINASTPTTPSALDTTEYYAFQLEPKDGYYINFKDINFTVYRGASSATTFALRSSLDNFATDIAAPVTITGTANTPITFDAAALTYVNTPVTFRLYPYGATTTGGTKLVGLTDFRFFGQVLYPSDFGDAPESYGTSGTGHHTGSVVYLGALPPDMDTSGLYSMNALRDNNVGTDDEDGVAAFPALAGGTATSVAGYAVTVAVHNASGRPAGLSGWIDWDGNGQFDTSELATAIVPDGATSVTLSWPNATLGGGDGRTGTYARFRISTDTIKNKLPTGMVNDGEIEDYFIAFTTPLPVTLSSFEAFKENNAAWLHWETSFERNSNHFVVERKAGSGQWLTIGTVKASGNSYGKAAYRFKDVSPVTGVNYYRLHMVDRDGSTQLSPVRMLEFDGGAGSVLLVPNPATNEASLMFNDEQHGRLTVKILTLDGKIVLSRDISHAGRACKLDLSSLTTGIYVIRVQGEDLCEQLKLVIR